MWRGQHCDGAATVDKIHRRLERLALAHLTFSLTKMWNHALEQEGASRETLAVLTVIYRDTLLGRDGLRLSKIAYLSETSLSTTTRYLRILLASGWIVRGAKKKYSIAPARLEDPISSIDKAVKLVADAAAALSTFQNGN